MWKNQIFYKPYEYGQYVGPGEKIFTVEEPETLSEFNHSTLTYEWRSTTINPRTNLTYVERDMFLHSRYVGSSLDVKCLAFIPSLAAFVLFGFFIWLFGRFQDSETFTENQDKTYERIKRKSPSEYSKEMGVTPEEMHMAMCDSLKRSGTPMLLSVDGPHFGATPSTNSTISMETQETHPSIVIDCAPLEEPAVSFDVSKLSPWPSELQKLCTKRLKAGWKCQSLSVSFSQTLIKGIRKRSFDHKRCICWDIFL